MSAEPVVVEADFVHGEDGVGTLATNDLRIPRRQLFEFANVRIDVLDDAGLGKVLGDGVDY